jgi:protein-disulfide isomerase
MPLPIHPDARMAAQAAHCAGEQGQFWEMRSLLYANRSALGREALEKHAATLRLDAGRFRRCLDGGTHLAEIDADTAAASVARITGTPTFLIGRRKGDVIEGRLVIGAQAAAVFDGAIRTELAAAGQ